MLNIPFINYYILMLTLYSLFTSGSEIALSTSPFTNRLLLHDSLCSASARLTGAPHPQEAAGSRRWERFCEQSACALTAAATRSARAGPVARALAARFPLNAYLALGESTPRPSGGRDAFPLAKPDRN